MNVYSNEERVFIIKNYYGGNSYRRVRDLFSIKYEDKPIPSVSTISKLVTKFESTASVAVTDGNEGNNNNNRIRHNEVNEELVLAMISQNSRYSIRHIASECGLHHSTVLRILKTHGYKSYKFQTHQELLLADFETRSTFCEIMQEKANRDQHFISSICFTDECTFTLNNEPNVQNTRTWTTENHHLTVCTGTQYPEKINIWVGIFKNRIIPFEIMGNLNSDMYLELLQNHIGPALDEAAAVDEDIWFQQDGCPAHYGINVREYLDLVFPNRWIGRGGGINWPARSPDLAPCDFFLWGHLKSKIYSKHYENLDLLRQAIFEECDNITDRQLANVRASFYNRLGYCLAENGGLFEHLL